MRKLLRPLPTFLILAFGLAWLVALPLWLGGGLANPLMPVIALAMMATPALSAVIVVQYVERPASRAEALGLKPVGGARRLIPFLALGLVVPIALIALALPIGALLGVYHPDLVHFSGFRAQLEALGAAMPPIPIAVLVAIQCVAIGFGAFINTIPALGEEIGWRGWLLPRLLPLGPVPAILISGVIWGLWHAPVVLLGYNYPGVPGWLGLLAMIGMCTVVGGVFGWLRLRSGTVWPAALAHGSFNAAAGMSMLFTAADHPFEATQATILGWTGWIVPIVLVAVLVATGRFKAVSPAVSRGAH